MSKEFIADDPEGDWRKSPRRSAVWEPAPEISPEVNDLLRETLTGSDGWREAARERVGLNNEMSEFVTKAELDNELTSLVDAQVAREDNNARKLFGQLNALRSQISNLEDRLYQLENPPEPEETPALGIENALDQLAKPIDFYAERDRASTPSVLTGIEVWQILGMKDCTCSCTTALFFGIASSEARARVAVMEAAGLHWYPDKGFTEVLFLQVTEGMWRNHTKLRSEPTIYIHESGLRARRGNSTYYEVFAEKRQLDAPIEAVSLA
ncbi:hypothetical protein AB0K16_22090 [Nonomuraea jabiensis]|uniref:hypothetical protein n=1 Tax=Nonomuraea jabiensis TaxID=882448 RepID=UPI003412D53D